MNSGSYVDPKFLTGEDYAHVSGGASGGVIGGSTATTTPSVSSANPHGYHAMQDYMQPYGGHHSAAAAAAVQSPIYGGYGGYSGYGVAGSAAAGGGRGSTPDTATAAQAAAAMYHSYQMPHPLMAAHHMGHLSNQLHQLSGHPSGGGNGGGNGGRSSNSGSPVGAGSPGLTANGAMPQNAGTPSSHPSYLNHSPPITSTPSAQGSAACEDPASPSHHMSHPSGQITPQSYSTGGHGGDGLSSDCSDSEDSPHGGSRANDGQMPVVYPWMKKIHVAGAGK